MRLQARCVIATCMPPVMTMVYRTIVAMVSGFRSISAVGNSTVIIAAFRITGIAPYRAKNPCALRIAQSRAVVATRGR